MDLDGTLLTTDKKISEINRQSILRAKSIGCKIILCSGRSPKSMQQYVDFLGLHSKGDYYLGNHGGTVVDASTEEVIKVHSIEPERIRWFVEMGRKYQDKMNVQLYRGDYFYVERRDSSTELYEKLTSMKAGILVQDLMALAEKDILKALFISIIPGYVLEVKDELEKQNMPMGMKLVASNEYLLEYADDSINKGVAVQKLMESMGIAMEEVICVGDSFNDITMIQKAGLGIAVQNAERSVKDIAKYVTERTNDNNAIAEIVDKFIIKSSSNV